MDGGSHFPDLLVNFSPMFHEPSLKNFTVLAVGWILSVGRRTISRVIRCSSTFGETKQHAALFDRRQHAPVHDRHA